MAKAYWQTLDKQTALKALKEAINAGDVNRSDLLISEMVQDAMAEGGGLRDIQFTEEVDISEMITTSQGQMALLEKVRIDVALGLAEIPLLYGPIYERVNGPFPGGVFQIDTNTLQANVVFLEKMEGGEVEFGTLETGAPALGSIQTYAAGFEWTEDMIEYDRTWSIELNNRAFGRAYNALLNHLHLSVIIGGSYGGGNSQPADSTGATTQEKTHLTFQGAYTESIQAKPQRRGTVLLASETNRFQIEEALLTPVYDVAGRPLPTVPIETIIYYDGETLKRGTDTITYPGVTPGTCFMIYPKQLMKEMLHHDLRIDIGSADISRLIEGQQVGRARRGMYADLANSVEKITLP